VVIAVADISVRVSDLTGAQGDKEAFGRLVVRSYPGLDGAKVLDVLPQEVSGLKAETELVEIEYTEPGSDQPRPMVVSREAFDGLAPDMGKVLAAARGLRGRRSRNDT
jgi:hypothetical protein